jgi:threonine aldolase
MEPRPRQLASDNVSGVCPEAWAALSEANRDHAPGYGDDAWTARAVAAIRKLVGRPEAQVFFVFTGTAANALSLATLCPPYGRVACHLAAHVAQDECGAPGFLGGGLQLSPLAGRDGKLEPESLSGWATFKDLHVGIPSAVTLTMSSELGTLYALAELRALKEVAQKYKLRVHLDGARFTNALAGLGCTAAEVVEASGCDALSLGGTKNGLMGSEAVVLLDPALAEAFEYRRKQAGQLASKHRFLSAPWVGALESGAYLRGGVHANAMAARLAAGFAVRGIQPVNPVQANAVFVNFPGRVADALKGKGWRFYAEECWGGDRFVCGWDTRAEDVDALLGDLDRAR